MKAKTINQWETYGKDNSHFDDGETLTNCPICSYTIRFNSDKLHSFRAGSELFEHIYASHSEFVVENPTE